MWTVVAPIAVALADVSVHSCQEAVTKNGKRLKRIRGATQAAAGVTAATSPVATLPAEQQPRPAEQPPTERKTAPNAHDGETKLHM